MSRIFEEYKAVIDKSLTSYNKPCDNLQKVIYEAMNYSLEAGGKRLRPALLLELYKIFGGDEDVLPFACAIEYIHTYSLIHDDLPAMDNDDLRRGKPTCHIAFGEANAILAGDALLTKAFEMMTKCSFSNKERQLKAILCIADSIGTEGMIGGQIIDIDSEGKKIPYEDLKELHRLKTGALLKAACVGGAILAEADEKNLIMVERYANALGVAFQIRDDILDATSTSEELGKPVGSDDKSCKSTYVTLLGEEKSEELCQKYTADALNALEEIEADTSTLKELTAELAQRKN